MTETKTCQTCEGEKKITIQTYWPYPGMIGTSFEKFKTIPCPTCNGEGSVKG